MTTLSTPTLRAFAPSRETSFNPSPSGAVSYTHLTLPTILRV